MSAPRILVLDHDALAALAKRWPQGAGFDEAVARIRQGFSPCCRAELDTSEVVSKGRNRGAGPVVCSRCGVVAYEQKR